VRDRPGHLISKDALIQRVAHGDVVALDGSQWQASVESDCLCLTMATWTDDQKEQITSRIADIKREVEARQQELDALSADCARLRNEAESVLCSSFLLTMPYIDLVLFGITSRLSA